MPKGDGYKLDKLSLAEHYYRGGYEQGYEAAASDIRAMLAETEAHVRALEKWALSDPAIEADPPILNGMHPAEGGAAGTRT